MRHWRWETWGGPPPEKMWNEDREKEKYIDSEIAGGGKGGVAAWCDISVLGCPAGRLAVPRREKVVRYCYYPWRSKYFLGAFGGFYDTCPRRPFRARE